jgi:hypothetical protein
VRAAVAVTVATAVSVACGAGGRAGQGVRFEMRTLEGGGGGALAALDVDGDGHVDLLSTAEALWTYLGTGGGGFRALQPTPAGEHPTALAVADWNEDGRADVAVANHETDYVSLLLGSGDGRFLPAPGSPLRPGMSPHPHAVAAGDVDGDGHADLVVDDRGGHAVLVLAGTGEGSFAPPRSVPVGGDPYRAMWLGDLDGDETLDLVTPNEREVAVLLGDGSGGFHAAPRSPVPATAPFSVTVADVDCDGRADLVTAPGEQADGVSVALGDAGGGFSPAPWSPLAGVTGTALVASGDLDADGCDDVVVAPWGAGHVTILYGGATGMARQEERVGENPWSVLVHDLDGDGRPDIAVGNEGSRDITILLNRGR